MKRIYPKTGLECSERQHKNSRYNPSRVAVVRYGKRLYTLVTGHGSNDDECFWQSGNTVYALTMNTGLGYCGLTVFSLGDTPNEFKADKPNRFDADRIADVFFQADHEIESALGKRGLDLAPSTIRTRLAEYCY